MFEMRTCNRQEHESMEWDERVCDQLIMRKEHNRKLVYGKYNVGVVH